MWFKKSRNKRENQLKGALASQQIQAEVLIESISDGIVLTDMQNRITLFNKAAAAMTEWPIEEAMGISVQSVFQLLADEKTNAVVDDNAHPFARVLREQVPVADETFQLVSRSSQRRYVSFSISAVINPKTNELIGTVGVVRDVSRAKSEEQQRADFVSTASHEMRTPVAAIEGYLALAMNDKVSKIDSKARDFLEKAHSSTQHLGQLFQDLLTSAKAEDGRLTSHPRVVELGAFVDQLAEDLKFGAEKKGLEMELISATPPPGSSEIVDARGKVIQPFYYTNVDPDRLREVVTNLFDNAVKYTPEGMISLGITGNDEVVQVRVSDTGPGISAEDLPHLFQKFYRVDNSATRTIGGTGLGLFICQKIIELYHGTIWAESEVGKGSTFYINLPRLSTQRAQQMQEQESAHPQA